MLYDDFLIEITKDEVIGLGYLSGEKNSNLVGVKKNKVGKIIYALNKWEIVVAWITRRIPTSLCNISLEKILMLYRCQM